MTPETRDLPDKCPHGKSYDEHCEECEVDLDVDDEEKGTLQ